LRGEAGSVGSANSAGDVSATIREENGEICVAVSPAIRTAG